MRGLGIRLRNEPGNKARNEAILSHPKYNRSLDTQALWFSPHCIDPFVVEEYAPGKCNWQAWIGVTRARASWFPYLQWPHQHN